MGKYFIKDKRFYMALAAIAVPIALQNLMGFSANVIDSIILGQLGDVAVSSASFGAQPYYLFMMIMFGIASGGAVLISQYWGKQNLVAIRRIFRLVIQLSVVLAAITGAVCFAIPTQIARIFTNDAEMIAGAAQYLRFHALGFVFFAFANAYMNSVRAVEKVKIAAVVYAVSAVINVFFNYALIFGNFGMPKMGIAGAALGTSIARVAEFLMVLFYMTFVEKHIGFTFGKLLKIKNDLFADFIKISTPVIVNEVFWGLSTLAMAAIVGRQGQAFMTAYSIVVLNIGTVANVHVFGTASAAGVLTGKAIGEGRRDEVPKIANSILLVSFIGGIVACLLLLFSIIPVRIFYNISDAALLTCAQLFVVQGLLQLTQSIDLTVIIGLLRGGGDVKTAMLLDSLGPWLIGVPLGFLASFVFHWPPVFVYLMLKIDSPVKTTLGLLRIKSGKWIRSMTHDVE